LGSVNVAFHSYESTHGHLPPAAVCGPDGTPLLSWRVLLLPYLEHDKLFDEFHLDEPWDSEHNRPLLDRMPRLYQVHHQRHVTAPPHHTVLKVFVGPGTPFEPGAKVTLTPADFPDGLDNTLLFVEAGDPVPWTKPDDIPFDPNQPLGLRGLFRHTFRAIAVESGYLNVRHDCDEAALRAAVTRNGGERVPPPWK
jgi:hypothetical protein